MKFIKLMVAANEVDYFILPTESIEEIQSSDENKLYPYWQSTVFLKNGEVRHTRSSVESIWVMLQQ